MYIYIYLFIWENSVGQAKSIRTFSVFILFCKVLAKQYIYILHYCCDSMQLHALRFRFEPQHYLVWPLIKELELIELRRNNENAEKRLKRMDEEFACRRVASFEYLRMRYGSKWFNLGPPEPLKDPSSDIITLSLVDSPQITEKGVFFSSLWQKERP